MDEQPSQPDPMGAALTWVSRILAVCIAIMAPVVGGHWLDRRLGTQFLALIGLGFGLVVGFLYLLAITGAFTKSGTPPKDRQDSEP